MGLLASVAVAVRIIRAVMTLKQMLVVRVAVVVAQFLQLAQAQRALVLVFRVVMVAQAAVLLVAVAVAVLQTGQTILVEQAVLAVLALRFQLLLVAQLQQLLL